MSSAYLSPFAVALAAFPGGLRPGVFPGCVGGRSQESGRGTALMERTWGWEACQGSGAALPWASSWLCDRALRPASNQRLPRKAPAQGSPEKARDKSPSLCASALSPFFCAVNTQPPLVRRRGGKRDCANSSYVYRSLALTERFHVIRYSPDLCGPPCTPIGPSSRPGVGICILSLPPRPEIVLERFGLGQV